MRVSGGAALEASMTLRVGSRCLGCQRQMAKFSVTAHGLSTPFSNWDSALRNNAIRNQQPLYRSRWTPRSWIRGQRSINSSRQDSVIAAAKQDKPWNSKAPWFLLSLFAAGATLGPALDGIHGTVHLLKYDSAQFQLGDVESSGWVALLLGTFYAVIGSLHIVGDHWQSTADPQHQQQLNTNQSLPYLLASIGTVALLLYSSAVLYDRSTPYPVIAAVLLGLASINFKVFEDTKQGLALAVLCACAAPISELIIMNVFGLWHYPHPDVFQNFGRGLPSWVSACYFFYTPAVGNLARFLWKHT